MVIAQSLLAKGNVRNPIVAAQAQDNALAQNEAMMEPHWRRDRHLNRS